MFRRTAWVLLSLLVACAITYALGPAVDIEMYFQPAARQWRDPYSVAGFYNPPWMLLGIWPMGLMSTWWASALVRALTILCAVSIVRRVSSSGVSVAAYLLSAPVLMDLLCGNVNAIILSAVMLPPWLALIVLSLKPQLTIGVMVWMLWVNRRNWFKTVMPLIIVAVISILMYGWWPIYMTNDADMLRTAEWNHGIWPWGVGVGVGLLMFSRSKLGTWASSPFMSPYVSGAGWVALTLWMSQRTPWLTLLVDVTLLVWGCVVIVT